MGIAYLDSQAKIHPRWHFWHINVGVFLKPALCFFLPCNDPDKQSICLWPPPWITVTHYVVEAECVGKAWAPDVTAHLFQCSHHYRITDLHLRLSTSSQVVSKTDLIKNWGILGFSSPWFNRFSVSVHRDCKDPQNCKLDSPDAEKPRMHNAQRHIWKLLQSVRVSQCQT